MIVITTILIFFIIIVIIAWHLDVKMLEDRIEELTEKLEQYEKTKTYSAGAVPMQLQSERPLQEVQKGDKNKART
nr:MAG TPA: Maltoporin periplasmic N-terminal extension [Caudoviricetes sp.]